MEKFTKHYPKSHLLAEAYGELGDLYLTVKDFSKALERYERVVRNYSQHPLVKKAYLGMEEGYRSLGKPEQSERILIEIVARFPNDDIFFESHLRLGVLYLSQKKIGEAVSVLSIAIRGPEERVTAQAQLKLGEAYLENENRELALLQFSRVVYLYPQQIEVIEEALLRLGGLYIEEKKISEARLVYQKLLEKTLKEEKREIAKKMLDQIQQGIIH
jgi:TolA-binding protein